VIKAYDIIYLTCLAMHMKDLKMINLCLSSVNKGPSNYKTLYAIYYLLDVSWWICS